MFEEVNITADYVKDSKLCPTNRWSFKWCIFIDNWFVEEEQVNSSWIKGIVTLSQSQDGQGAVPSLKAESSQQFNAYILLK